MDIAKFNIYNNCREAVRLYCILKNIEQEFFRAYATHRGNNGRFEYNDINFHDNFETSIFNKVRSVCGEWFGKPLCIPDHPMKQHFDRYYNKDKK